MAKKPISLSPTTAKRLARVIRKVDGRGTPQDSKTYDFSDGQNLWIEPVSNAAYPMTGSSAYKWIYTCNVFTGPFVTSALTGTVKALNTYERNNTTTSASGYAIVGSPECGDISGVSAIPAAGQRYPLRRLEEDEDDTAVKKFFYASTERNDPIIQGP